MFVYTIEHVIGGFFLSLAALWYLYISLANWIKYRKCTHEEYRETSACDAVCCNCSKNLGFIGAVRGDK